MSKYYWLKLKRDFFKRHDIRIVEEMPNGKEYILFYLKLLCESVDHDGTLRFSDEVPYNEQMLATITNTNVDIVRSAVKIFTELHMMDILDDGTIFLREVDGMIGSAANNDNANRQRRFRERQKEENLSLPLQERYESVTKNNESKSIEIDIEKDKDTRVNYQQIADMYNETCVSFPKVKFISNKRAKAIKARLNTYSTDDFKTLFEKAEASDFLKGKNGRNWSATFDWLIADANMAKVLDGNYDNRAEKPKPTGNVVIPMPDYIRKQVEQSDREREARQLDRDSLLKEIDEMKGEMNES